MVKRLSALFLALVTLCGSSTVLAAEEKTGVHVHYNHTFDSVKTGDAFHDSTSGLGMSYAKGSWRAVSGKAAIQNRSVQIHSADWRWWNVSYFEEIMGFSFDILVDENYGGKLQLSINTQDKATTTEGLSGVAVSISKSGNDVKLKDHRGNDLATLTEGVHSIDVVFNRASKKYTVKLDGEVLTDNANFRSAVYSIHGMRIQVDPGAKDKYVHIDNFKAYTVGRLPAQKHSYQEPGKLPEVVIPEAPSEGLHVYFNKEAIDLHEHAPIEEGEHIYLPLTQSLAAIGISAEQSENGLTVFETDGVRVICKAGIDLVRYGEGAIRLDACLREENGVLYAPLSFFARVFGAKVWLHEQTGTLVLTCGDLLRDDILRLYNGVFFMNGEPYYEISFNKFDLNNQLNADPTLNGTGGYKDATWNNAESCLAGAEKALKELSENGFKTIRVFCSNINLNRKQSELDRYWKTVDTMYDLCDKYGIQVVACMSLTTEEFLDGEYVDGVWVTKKENYFDYFTKSDSVSRQNAYDFLTEYVKRYQNRRTILMWEICNEGNLGADVGGAVGSVTFSLIQLAHFYNDFARKLHELDPERLVTGGDSMLRSAQWHLLSGVLAGKNDPDWSVDTDLQRKKALMLLHEELDVISIHGYDVGYETNSGHGLVKNTETGKTEIITYDYYRSEAYSLGKGLYNGEVGGQMGKSYKNTSKEAAKERATYLQSIVDAGIQLSHWWSYGSNRNGGFGNDLDSWSVTVQKTPETFKAIRDANAALKAKWMVNGVEVPSYDLPGADLETYDGTDLLLPDETSTGCGSLIGARMLPLLLLTAIPFMTFRKKYRI